MGAPKCSTCTKISCCSVFKSTFVTRHGFRNLEPVGIDRRLALQFSFSENLTIPTRNREYCNNRKMINPLSVNETIDRLVELNGQKVSIFGILSLEFEGQCITHVPKSELRSNDIGNYASSIWANFDLDSIGQRKQWLDQFDGRHVRLDGILNTPCPGHDGCGHLSMWPAEVTVTAIQKYAIGQ